MYLSYIWVHEWQKMEGEMNFSFKSNQSAIISYQAIEISHSSSNHQSVNFQKEKNAVA